MCLVEKKRKIGRWKEVGCEVRLIINVYPFARAIFNRHFDSLSDILLPNSNTPREERGRKVNEWLA